MGPGAHIVAVCQPCVAVLAAAAVMAQAGNPAQPRSMTLMAGPIDTRVNPTKVNELAKTRTIEWFERTLIASVPYALPRRVPPRLSGLRATRRLHEHEYRAPHQGASGALRQSRRGEVEKAAVTKAFYDEYFAVLDLTAEFYLETVKLVFQEHALPLGKLDWHGQKGRAGGDPQAPCCSRWRASATTSAPSARRWPRTICARKLRPYLKRHHMQAGVGHYGVFSGTRWQNQIYPMVKNVILSSD